MQNNNEIVIEIMNEEYDVVLNNSVPTTSGSNEELNHYRLHGLEFDDQHPIRAIIGLRDELDKIEALQTVYSDQKQVADYYLWEDENEMHEPREHRFVAICGDARTIKLCESEDIFGITVDTAGFIGGQADIARNHTYGLVVTTGTALVICETDVEVGDYVVSNNYGYAKKTDSKYGYLVIAINDIEDVKYATISLTVSSSRLGIISDDMVALSDRLGVAEKNVTSAINIANAAYRKAETAGDIVVDDEALADKINDMLEDIVASVDKVEIETAQANKTATEARVIAENAANEAEKIRENAEKTANAANSNVNGLIEQMKPILTWTDTESHNSGAEYFIDYIENDIATKSEVMTVDTGLKSALTEVKRNASELHTLVTSICKYSYGEYSQAYGLAVEQAANILEEGMIYIPSKNHSETYDNITREFTVGYFYEWDGVKWIESDSPMVTLSTEYVFGSDAIPFWIPIQDVEYDGVVYEKDKLYEWQGTMWRAVAELQENVMNRMVSRIRQTSNEIAAEIVNARGDAASLGLAMDEISSKIGLVVTKNEDGDDVPNVASFFLEANKEGSTATLNADKIVMTGDVAFVSADDLGANGTTVIDGQKVFTGLLQSWNFKDENDTVYSDEGTLINLNDGTITSKNFAIDVDGNAYISGRINASSGKIADCEITEAVVDEEGNVVKPSQLTVPFANITGRMTFYEGDVYDEYGNVLQTEEYYLQAEPTEKYPYYIYFPGFQLSEGAGVEIDAANIVNLTVSAAQITDKLTANQIEVEGLITAEYIEALGITVSSAQITDKLTADQIDASTLTVNRFYAETLDDHDHPVGQVSIDSTGLTISDNQDNSVSITPSGDIFLSRSGGSIGVDASGISLHANGFGAQNGGAIDIQKGGGVIIGGDTISISTASGAAGIAIEGNTITLNGSIGVGEESGIATTEQLERVESDLMSMIAGPDSELEKVAGYMHIKFDELDAEIAAIKKKIGM